MRDHPTSIRLTNELKKTLRRVAKDEHRSIGGLVAHILETWLEAHQRRDPTTSEPVGDR